MADFVVQAQQIVNAVTPVLQVTFAILRSAPYAVFYINDVTDSSLSVYITFNIGYLGNTMVWNVVNSTTTTTGPVTPTAPPDPTTVYYPFVDGHSYTVTVSTFSTNNFNTTPIDTFTSNPPVTMVFLVPAPNQSNFNLTNSDSGINSSVLAFTAPQYGAGVTGTMSIISTEPGTSSALLENTFVVNLNQQSMGLINYPPYTDLSTTVTPALFGLTRYCINYPFKWSYSYYIILKIGSNVYQSTTTTAVNVINMGSGGSIDCEVDFNGMSFIPSLTARFPTNVAGSQPTVNNSLKFYIASSKYNNSEKGVLIQSIFNLTTSFDPNIYPINLTINDEQPYTNPYNTINITSTTGTTTINYPLFDMNDYSIGVSSNGNTGSSSVTQFSSNYVPTTVNINPVTVQFSIPYVGIQNLSTPLIFKLYENTINSTPVYTADLRVNYFWPQPWQIAVTSPTSSGIIYTKYPNISSIIYPLLTGTSYIFTLTKGNERQLRSNVFTYNATQTAITATQSTPNPFQFDFNTAFMRYTGGNNVQRPYISKIPGTWGTYYNTLEVNLYTETNTSPLETFEVQYSLIDTVPYDQIINTYPDAVDSTFLSPWPNSINNWRIVQGAGSTGFSPASTTASTVNTLSYPLVAGVNYNINTQPPDPSSAGSNPYKADYYKTYQPTYSLASQPRTITFNLPNFGFIDYTRSTILFRLYQDTTSSTPLRTLKIQPGAQVEPWKITVVSPGSTGSTGTIVSSYPNISTINYPLIGGNTYIFTAILYANQLGPSFNSPTTTNVSNTFTYIPPPINFNSPTTNNITVEDGVAESGILSVSGYLYGVIQSITWTLDTGTGPSIITPSSLFAITNNLKPKFSSILSINNPKNAFAYTDRGTYACTVTDSFTTSTVTYNVNVIPVAPVFSGNISSQGGILEGTGTTYTFTAPPLSKGTIPITYVWTFKANGQSTATTISTKIGDGTCTITLSQASLGIYTVTASNFVGSSTTLSTSITLVGDRPVVNKILSQIVCKGTTVCLENKQTVTPAPTYQWYLNGNQIYGATGSFYNIYELVYPTAGKYDCVATNRFGSVPSVAAILNVFKTSNSGLGNVETFRSGSGYTIPPYLGLYGCGSQGELKYPTVDVHYIRSVRITGGNLLFANKDVTVSAIGNYGGAVLRPIIDKLPTEWYISGAQVPSELVGKTVYQPIVVTVNGNGSGARILPELNTSLGSNIFEITEGRTIVDYWPPAPLQQITSERIPLLPAPGGPVFRFTPWTSYQGRPILTYYVNPPEEINFERTFTVTYTVAGSDTPTPIYGPTGYNVTGGGIIAAFKWNVGPNVSSVNLVYSDTIREPQRGPPVYVSPQYIGDNGTVQGPILNSTKVKPCVLCYSGAINAGAYPGADVCPPPRCAVRVISTNTLNSFEARMKINNKVPSEALVEVTWNDITWSIDGYRQRSRSMDLGINNVRIYEPEIRIVDPGNGYMTQPLLQLLIYKPNPSDYRPNSGSFVPWTDTAWISPDGNRSHYCAKAWYYCDIANNVNVTLSPEITAIQLSPNNISGGQALSAFNTIFGIVTSCLNWQAYNAPRPGAVTGKLADLQSASSKYYSWLYSAEGGNGDGFRTSIYNEGVTGYTGPTGPSFDGSLARVQYYMSLGGGLVDISSRNNNNNNFTAGTAISAALTTVLTGVNAAFLASATPAALANLALISPQIAGGATTAGQVASEAVAAIAAAQNSFGYSTLSINNPLVILGSSQNASQAVIAGAREEYMRAQQIFEASGVDVSLKLDIYNGNKTILSNTITELESYFNARQTAARAIFTNYTDSIRDIKAAVVNLSKAVDARLPGTLRLIAEAGMQNATAELVAQRAAILSQGGEHIAAATEALNNAKSAFVDAAKTAISYGRGALAQTGLTENVTAVNKAQEAINLIDSNPTAFEDSIDAIVAYITTEGGEINNLRTLNGVAGDFDRIIWNTVRPEITISESETLSYDFMQVYSKTVVEEWSARVSSSLDLYKAALEARSEASNIAERLGSRLASLESAAARETAAALAARLAVAGAGGRASTTVISNVAQRALLTAASAAGRITLSAAISGIFNVALLIVTGIGIATSALAKSSAVPSPDLTITYWMTDGILPFTPGSILVSPGVRIESLYVLDPGSGYDPGNTTVTIQTGGIAVNSPYFQGSSNTTSKNITAPVDVISTPNLYVLTGIGIESQGNGFTGAPSIEISGGGGDGTARAVADMSCSALGPIQYTSTDYFVTAPTVRIEHGTDLLNPATAIAQLSTNIGSGVLRGLKVPPVDINNAFPFIGGFDPTNSQFRTPGTNFPLSDAKLQELIQSWIFVTISPPGGSGVQATAVVTGRIVPKIPVSDGFIQVTGFIVTNGGSGYSSPPSAGVGLTPLGKQKLLFNNGSTVSPIAIMDHPIDKILITDNGLGYDEIPKIKLLDNVSGNLVGTPVGTTGYASNFTSTVKARGFQYAAGCGASIVPDYYIQNFTVVSGGTGYTGPPDIGITGTGVVTNVIDSATVVSTTTTTQGVSIGVGISGGYYESEPLSEFSSKDQAGLNIQLIPASNDTIADSQAYAIPVMNGRIIDCTNGIGIACYGVPLTQLPYTPAGINVTITPVDGNGSGAVITVSKYHYSFDLNAYILNKFTITNAGSNYTTSPLVTVAFVDSSSNELAKAHFYPRIGGPIASVKVVNSSVGFEYTPTTKLLPYGQTGNIGGSYIPATLTVNLTQLTRGSVSMVYLGDRQPTIYNTRPDVTLYDMPRLGGNKAIVTANMGLFYLSVNALIGGNGYTYPPTVVFKSDSGLGGGAVAKAVLGENGSVIKVIFATFGSGWINEFIQMSFVPHPLDDANNITSAYGSCEAIFSTVIGPPKVIAHSFDGNGSNAEFNVAVNTGLYLTGATGFMPFIDGILDVPNTANGIASGAFGNQKYITDLVFSEPSQCFEIGNYAFSGCTGLRSAYIPKSVERIGRGAFHNCPNLKIVQFEGLTGPAFGTNAFLGCTGVHFYLTRGATGVVSSYGGGTGWLGLSTSNHLGLPVGLTGITGPNYNILANKPQGILGFTPLKQAIIPIPDLSESNFSVACDSEGNVYWNNNSLNAIQKVDLNGNQTVFSNELYPVRSLTITGDNMYVVTSANNNIYQIPLTGSPTWTAVCSIPSGYLIASDSAGNVYVVSSTTYIIYYFATAAGNPANDFIPEVYVTLPTSTILSSMCGGHFGNPELVQSVGVIAAGLTIAINSLRVILSYSSPDVSEDPVLVATGLHATSGLAYDNAGNLYSGSTASTLRGITKITSDGLHISPYAPGFSTVGGVAISPKGFIFFSDGSNLCQLPIAITSVSIQVKEALKSHKYETITAMLLPGTQVTLQPSEIYEINATLAPGASSGQLPSDNPITYVAPNYDRTITLPRPSTQGIGYATSFKPGVPTVITIGSYKPTAVIYNDTSPPTFTVYSNGANLPIRPREFVFSGDGNPLYFTVGPGESWIFDDAGAGAGVAGAYNYYFFLNLYSIGLTVFTLTDNNSQSFIPGVRGTPPPVCKPKKQGMDYSQYLSSNVQNSEYPPYKEKPLDASEWIRRKRMTSSVKFGSC